MKISTRARYALRSMVVIARNADPDNPISLDKVSHATQISRRYLEQLAMALKGAALLRSVSGRKGGYYLAKPAEGIKLGQIVEAAIGPINVVECAAQPETCIRSDGCGCRLLYMLLNQRVKEVLDNQSLADLASKGWFAEMSRELSALPHVPQDSDGEPSRARAGGRPAS